MGKLMSKSKNNLLLSNHDIVQICTKLNIKLNAILSKDEYEDINPEIGCYIINLQDSEIGNGTHWTALVITKRWGIYYDPFGIAIPRPIKHFLSRNKTNIPVYYSPDQIQPLQSVFCGYYCIYFMFFASVLNGKHWNGHYILDKHNSIYSLENRHLNDRILQNLIKKLLR